MGRVSLSDEDVDAHCLELKAQQVTKLEEITSVSSSSNLLIVHRGSSILHPESA